MSLPAPNDRQRRVIQLSSEWGITLPPTPGRLARPDFPPSYRTPGDDQTAEDLMIRHAAEVAQLRPKSGLSRAFSTGNLKKGKNWDPQAIFEVLESWVGSCGSAGVAEALIVKLAASGVDLSGLQTQKSGLLNRRRSLDHSVDKTRLLRLAVERGQLDMVQVFVPHADPQSLDAAVPIALRSGDRQIVEVLLRYGAKVSQTADGQDAFRQACVVHGLADLVALVLQSDGRPSHECVSQGLSAASKAGCLQIVLHLSRSTADGDFNRAEALKTAVNNGRRDIAIAIAMGNKPPRSPGLEEAFQMLTENPSLDATTKLELAELLLCCGAHGDILSQALELACESQFYDMAKLLAAYGVSIEYNNATVLKTAISRGQVDLVRSLLNDKTTLSPAVASSCVKLIPRQANFDVRHALLTLLLRRGAKGTSLHECLIQAAQSGDLQAAELLLTPRFPDSPPSPDARTRTRARLSNRHEMASPDHRDGEALRTAVLRADVKMTAIILGARPSIETLTGVFPLTKNLSTTDRYQMVDLFLRSALIGPALHLALQDAINEDRSRRDDSLIKLLLQHNADVNYNNGAGLQGVIMQRDISLLGILLQKASPQTAAARIADVMKINDHRARFEMMALLLNVGAVIGVQEVAEALLEALCEKPVDMSLLRLILQQGNAEVNALDGAITQKAVQNNDPKVLELVLGIGKPTPTTINRTLSELSLLPSNDAKSWKLKIILSRAAKKPDLSNLLVSEVQTLIQGNHQHTSISTLKQLLEAGADPNSIQGAALCMAVGSADTLITDLLFECPVPPNAASCGLALRHALRISDPMDRLSFAKRLVEGGAYPLEVNMALVHAIGAFSEDLTLINHLANYADASDGDALALAIVKESPGLLEIILSKTKHSMEIRDGALINAMNIKEWTPRLAICKQLATAGVSTEVASNALLVASRDGDLELGDVLIAHGASICSNDGQAIIEACRGGSVQVLDVLLRSNLDPQKSTLERGFQAATEVRDLNKRAMVFQKLLKKGVSGEVVDAQLVSAVRYGEAGQEILRVLLAAGADPNYSSGEAVVAATRSAFIGNLELLLGLWHEGGNQKKASAPTLLRALKACWKLSHDTRFQIIEDLMKAGMPATEEVHIALSKAVNEDVPDEKLIKLLIDCGASPLTNACKSLVDATQKIAASTLKLLLAVDIPEADINRVFTGGFTEENFGTWFTEDGLEIARMLLEKGAKGDALSGTLILAMKNRANETAELADQFVDVLVEHGADVNFQDGEPLRQAASQANVEWTRKLLTCGPSSETLLLGFQHIFDTALSPDEAIRLFEMFTEYHDDDVRMDVTTVRHGTTPVLVRAISQYPRSTEILQVLLDAGFYHDQVTMCRVHPGIEEEEEVTLLAWAIAQPQKKVSTAMIDLLVQRGANVNFETGITRCTPLMLAIEARRPDVVKLLLIEGAEVDVTDSLGRTPLSMATDAGGDLAIQMMGNLLALEPSRDDGSLHNAARELNLPAVKVLIQAGHDPDFPSPLHNGRSALGEVCRHGSNSGELTTDREKAMQKVMTLLVEAGSDLTLKSHGKPLLHLCFDAVDPISTTRSFLKVAMWKHINKPFNHYTDGEYTYSPTMYITKILPQSETRDQLLKLIKANRGIDVYYANAGDQPEDAVALPEDLEIQERERKARLQRIAKETEDHAILLARKKEIAGVEQQIWAHKAELEDARRRRLHNEDMDAVRSKSQLEEQLFNASLQRRLNEQRVLTDASMARARAIASAEVEAEDGRQRKLLEWEAKMNTERVDNARALSAMRISEREEIERIDRGADDRVKRRLEAQKKLVDSQEKLAKRIAGGPTGSGDTRRQIGYVEELN